MSRRLPTTRRGRASLLHAMASLAVALLVSAVAFLVWFPGAYASIAGGFTLFAILVSVDVVSGPLLTAVVADPAKPAPEFRRDVFIIAAVQLAALAYGVHVLSLARPIATVFEIDRMRVISAAEVDANDLKDAPADLRKPSWTGPRILAAATPRTREEKLQAIDLAIGGLDISNVPKNWRPYETQNTSAWNRAKPVAQLAARYPSLQGQISRVVERTGVPIDGLRFLPLIARQGSGSVILAPPDARIVEILSVDGFF